jgi:hypothetical protein
MGDLQQIILTNGFVQRISRRNEKGVPGKLIRIDNAQRYLVEVIYHVLPATFGGDQV